MKKPKKRAGVFRLALTLGLVGAYLLCMGFILLGLVRGDFRSKIADVDSKQIDQQLTLAANENKPAETSAPEQAVSAAPMDKPPVQAAVSETIQPQSSRWLMAGVGVVVGVCVLALGGMCYLQWKAMKRMAAVVAAPVAKGVSLASLALPEKAAAPVVPEVSARLLGEVKRLEERLHEMEAVQKQPPASAAPIPAIAAASSQPEPAPEISTRLMGEVKRLEERLHEMEAAQKQPPVPEAPVVVAAVQPDLTPVVQEISTRLMGEFKRLEERLHEMEAVQKHPPVVETPAPVVPVQPEPAPVVQEIITRQTDEIKRLEERLHKMETAQIQLPAPKAPVPAAPAPPFIVTSEPALAMASASAIVAPKPAPVAAPAPAIVMAPKLVVPIVAAPEPAPAPVIAAAPKPAPAIVAVPPPVFSVASAEPESLSVAEEPVSENAADSVEAITLLLSKGQTLLKMGEPQAALDCFDRVISLDSGNTDALVKKGAALERLQRLSEAIDCYNIAIERDGANTMAYLYKGGVYNRLERYGEALECYEQALKSRQKGQAANVIIDG